MPNRQCRLWGSYLAFLHSFVSPTGYIDRCVCVCMRACVRACRIISMTMCVDHHSTWVVSATPAARRRKE